MCRNRRAVVIPVCEHLSVTADEAEPPYGDPPDLTIVIALMEATWVRARGLIEFFIGPKRGRIHASDFAPRWSLPKALRKTLRAYAQHISHHLVHILEAPE